MNKDFISKVMGLAKGVLPFYLFALLPLSVCAQKSLTVKLDAAGQLATKIAEDQRFQIADLTISGPMDGADLKLLQQIVTRTKTNKNNPGECLVTALDLSGATIVDSNVKGGLKTQAGELPAGIFAGAKSLTKMVLPSSLTAIGKEAFQTCESLTAITIPASVKQIANEAFEDCKSITAMALPKGITAIAPQLFNGCKALKSVTIPNGVTIIGGSAFKGCSSLTNITLPATVNEIETSAFFNCTNLKSIEMASVSKIGAGAFTDCKNLERVTLNRISSLGMIALPPSRDAAA